MALGGLTALVVTPVFALSFFTAYGSPDELRPGWLSLMETPLNPGWGDRSRLDHDL